MSEAKLKVTGAQVRSFRRRAGGLDQRLPPGAGSLQRAAWAGLQDSMPRAALLSLHARIDGVGPAALDDPSLVQVWGPRFQLYDPAMGAISMRWIMLHTIEETARHLGHADILREQLDGHIGG